MPLRFFHGTSDRLAKHIDVDGLVPQTRPMSANRGNFSTIPGYTEDLVFLAPCIEEAAFYAIASSNYTRTPPVIYEVVLPDDQNLKVSDDHILDQMLKEVIRVTGLHPPEYDDDGDICIFGVSTVEIIGWTGVIEGNSELFLSNLPLKIEDLKPSPHGSNESFDTFIRKYHPNADIPALLSSIRNAAIRAQGDHWEKSISSDREPSVAYSGIISSANIKRLSQAQFFDAAKRSAQGRFELGMWDHTPAPAARRPRMR